MNATQTAIVTALKDSNSYLTVTELVQVTGMARTTVRDNLKKLIAVDEIGVLNEDGQKRYTNIPEVPDALIKADDEAAVRRAALVEDSMPIPLREDSKVVVPSVEIEVFRSEVDTDANETLQNAISNFLSLAWSAVSEKGRLYWLAKAEALES